MMTEAEMKQLVDSQQATIERLSKREKAFREKAERLSEAFEEDLAEKDKTISQLRAALEFECGNRCHPEHNPCSARETLARTSGEKC